MTGPSDGGQQGKGRPAGDRQGGDPGDSWEQRAAGLTSEIQRWLIKTSARSMRDELGGQVRKALRGSDSGPGDTWATATTEPPHAADEAPECAWCPVCRAARRISQARAAGDSGAAPRLTDAADVVAGAVRDALAGIDSILSYRPGEPAGAESPTGGPPDGGPPEGGPPEGGPPADAADEHAREPENEPGHRG